MDPYQQARVLIDAVHAADPVRTAENQAAELKYADRMEFWIQQRVPDASPLLRLGARCQHLERWAIPRSSFPMDRAGYHAWRQALYLKQAERARGLLIEAGVAAAEAEELATWVSKRALRSNAGTQALEDTACLVFLETEIEAFAAQHADYPREKFIHILRRTWQKMSPRARELALTLRLAPEIASLVHEATTPVGPPTAPDSPAAPPAPPEA
jgi:tRNAThr (cytosine32-N3)-methyltransferase